MKIKVNSTALKNAVKDVQKALDKKPVLDILRCIIIDAEKNAVFLKTADAEISVVRKLTAEIEEHGKTAAVFENGLSAALNLPDGEITITADDKQLTITYPNGTFSLPVKNADYFPPAKSPNNDAETISLPTKLMATAIPQAIPALSTTEVHRILCYICFDFSEDSLNVVGCDGRMMVCNRIKGSFGQPKQIAISAKAGQVLLALSKETPVIKMRTDGERAVFSDGEIFSMYVTLAVVGHYPDYNAIISPIRENIHLRADLDRKELIGSLGRLMAFSSADSLARLSFTYNSLTIHSRDMDFNKQSEETLSCSTGGDTSEMEIGMNGRNMKSMLAVLPTDNVCLLLQDASRAMLIEPIVPEYEGGMATEILLMPMYLNKA